MPAPWLPYTLIKCSPAANQLIRNMTTPWGKKLYSNTLIRNIGQEIYKQEDEIVTAVKKNYAQYKNSTEFQFAIKIRDKTKPAAWYLPEDDKITILPAKDKLGKAPLQVLVEKFQGQS
eukprot:TRINITY_DN18914_c0_g1_i1.p3 TRINITY_DN18914_c0_g1~~TRINITY_DN18914_c0_g1_i1.p3  ORF type:complete len:118 (-),score=8.82 TRINITY_DN18914_c0_g1_i1:118-471(-)